jgi:hypothetical protein
MGGVGITALYLVSQLLQFGHNIIGKVVRFGLSEKFNYKFLSLLGIEIGARYIIMLLVGSCAF